MACQRGLSPSTLIKNDTSNKLNSRSAIGVIIELGENIPVFVADDLGCGVDEAVLGDGAVLLHLRRQKQTRRRHQQRVARVQTITHVKATEEN